MSASMVMRTSCDARAPQDDGDSPAFVASASRDSTLSQDALDLDPIQSNQINVDAPFRSRSLALPPDAA